MKIHLFSLVLFAALCNIFVGCKKDDPPPPAAEKETNRNIMIGGQLQSEFTQVASDNDGGVSCEWMSSADSSIHITYQTGHGEGKYSIHVGPYNKQNHDWMNISQFGILRIGMKGLSGNESVKVRIRDLNGLGATMTASARFDHLTTDWHDYYINFENDFNGLDREKIAVVAEFILDTIATSIAIQIVQFMTPARLFETNPNVLIDGNLGSHFDLGISTQHRHSTWVSQDTADHCLRFSYPEGNDWGVAFFTIETPRDSFSNWMNFAHYGLLRIRMRGQSGGESVTIGLKDRNDRGDGREPKTTISEVTNDFKDYYVNLSDMTPLDLTSLSVVPEFIFGPASETIEVRDIEFLPSADQIQTNPMVYVNGRIGDGFDLGVASSGGRSDWITIDSLNRCLHAVYPAGEQWGSLFFTAGVPRDTFPNWMDFNSYATLRFRIRGTQGFESVNIGLKDIYNSIPRASLTIPITGLTTDWRDCPISVREFNPINIRQLHVVAEFIFGQDPESIEIKDVQYLTTEPEAHEENANPLVVSQGYLGNGFGMGVDDSHHDRDWLQYDSLNGFYHMNYPAGHSWGAVFITVGNPTPTGRPWMNFSLYDSIRITVRGAHGNESVQFGLKDRIDYDDGNETKLDVSGISSEWQNISFPLSAFITANLKELYVVGEFVFSDSAQTIDFKNITYVRRQP
jgi:hypothetical protein